MVSPNRHEMKVSIVVVECLRNATKLTNLQKENRVHGHIVVNLIGIDAKSVGPTAVKSRAAPRRRLGPASYSSFGRFDRVRPSESSKFTIWRFL